MIFIISATENHLDSPVHGRFGHADYYLVVDSDTMGLQTIPGPVENLPAHGMEEFAKHQAEAIVSGNFGIHAFADLRDKGFKAFVARKMTARQAIQGVLAGEILEAQEPTIKKDLHHHDEK